MGGAGCIACARRGMNPVPATHVRSGCGQTGGGMRAAVPVSVGREGAAAPAQRLRLHSEYMGSTSPSASMIDVRRRLPWCREQRQCARACHGATCRTVVTLNNIAKTMRCKCGEGDKRFNVYPVVVALDVFPTPSRTATCVAKVPHRPRRRPIAAGNLRFIAGRRRRADPDYPSKVCGPHRRPRQRVATA